jgi:hypothetical protein
MECAPNPATSTGRQIDESGVRNPYEDAYRENDVTSSSLATKDHHQVYDSSVNDYEFLTKIIDSRPQTASSRHRNRQPMRVYRGSHIDGSTVIPFDEFIHHHQSPGKKNGSIILSAAETNRILRTKVSSSHHENHNHMRVGEDAWSSMEPETSIVDPATDRETENQEEFPMSMSRVVSPQTAHRRSGRWKSKADQIVAKSYDDLGYLKRSYPMNRPIAGHFFFPSLVLGLKEIGKQRYNKTRSLLARSRMS